MTDHDRGAYTPGAYNPGADAPLAFDARGPRDRQPMPMTLVASGVVLLVILGALFLAYRGGVRGSAEAPRPVGEPIGAIKTAAVPAAAGSDAAPGMDVYAAQNVPNAKPTFAPPPEAPAPRPAPTQLQVHAVSPPPVRIETAEAPASKAPAAVATTPTTGAPRTAIRPGAADAVADRPVRLAQAEAVPAVPALRPATTLKTPAVDKPSPAKAVIDKPVASKPVTQTAAATTDAAPAGGSAVQIGAFSSRELADKGYADVSGMMSGRMAGKGRHVEPVAHGDKTVFRTTITGFPDHAAAKAFCEALSAKGHACFAKG